MKKLILLLLVVLTACVDLSAQNFERPVRRKFSAEGWLDHRTGIYRERDQKVTISVYTNQVWVQIYDDVVDVYIWKRDHWTLSTENISRFSEKPEKIMVAHGLTCNTYRNVSLQISILKNSTTVTFIKENGCSLKSFSIPKPTYTETYPDRYPQRRPYPYYYRPGRVY